MKPQRSLLIGLSWLLTPPQPLSIMSRCEVTEVLHGEVTEVLHELDTLVAVAGPASS